MWLWELLWKFEELLICHFESTHEREEIFLWISAKKLFSIPFDSLTSSSAIAKADAEWWCHMWNAMSKRKSKRSFSMNKALKTHWEAYRKSNGIGNET